MNPFLFAGLAIFVVLLVATVLAWFHPAKLRPTWFWYACLLAAVVLSIVGIST